MLAAQIARDKTLHGYFFDRKALLELETHVPEGLEVN